jgi:hypothetical protein
VVHVRREDEKTYPGVKPGRYLVDDQGRIKYKTDTPIAQESKKMDNGADAPKAFTAPQPQLFQSIITGILGGTLEWGLFIIGVLIAVAMEFSGVRALPFAVGMYIPLGATTPIFVGGLLRWLTDRIRGGSGSDVETETSPGVLLSSGYIAGGTLCGLIIAFFSVPYMADFNRAINMAAPLGRNIATEEQKSAITKTLAEARKEGEATLAEIQDESLRKSGEERLKEEAVEIETSEYSGVWLDSNSGKTTALAAFLALMILLVIVGVGKNPELDEPNPPRPL